MKKSITQLSIFLENRVGRLNEVTELLADNNISLKSVELVEAGDFGILRLIVDNASKAIEVLEKNGITVQKTPVIAVEIANEVGCFNRVVSLLASEGINIQYTYTLHGGNIGTFVIKTDPVEMLRAIEVLEEDGVKIVDEV